MAFNPGLDRHSVDRWINLMKRWTGSLRRPDFRTALALRIAALFATLLAAACLLAWSDAYVTTVLIGGLALWQGWLLYGFVLQGHRRITRFIAALEQVDFSQRPAPDREDPVFAELTEALGQAFDRLLTKRTDQQADQMLLGALLERAPVALLMIEPDGRTDLMNAAARGLFKKGEPALTDQGGGADYGAAFRETLNNLAPGETRLASFLAENGALRVKLTASQLTQRGETRRLVSVENIQSALDATELEAWNNLVRVLTHEMMNSLTPVSSLAETVNSLLDDVAARLSKADGSVTGDLGDIRDAVNTIGRRAEGLLHFVQGYRRLTRVPMPTRQRFALAEVFERLRRLMAPDCMARGIDLTADVSPPHLLLNADPDLLEQALINLLRNASDALQDWEGTRRITMRAALDEDGAVIVAVADTGPGIPAEIAEKVFVPFFTTKPSGSGVGLSITKQVMTAHGGAVGLSGSEDGGTVISLRFP